MGQWTLESRNLRGGWEAHGAPSQAGRAEATTWPTSSLKDADEPLKVWGAGNGHHPPRHLPTVPKGDPKRLSSSPVSA